MQVQEKAQTNNKNITKSPFGHFHKHLVVGTHQCKEETIVINNKGNNLNIVLQSYKVIYIL